jgi:hypothetical protein
MLQIMEGEMQYNYSWGTTDILSSRIRVLRRFQYLTVVLEQEGFNPDVFANVNPVSGELITKTETDSEDDMGLKRRITILKIQIPLSLNPKPEDMFRIQYKTTIQNSS